MVDRGAAAASARADEGVSAVKNSPLFGSAPASNDGPSRFERKEPYAERLIDPVPGSTRTVYNVHIKGSLDDMLRATGQRVDPAPPKPAPPPHSDFEAFMQSGPGNKASRALFRVLRGIYGKVMNARSTEEEVYKECFNARYSNTPMKDVNDEWEMRCLLYTDLIRLALDKFNAWIPNVSMETFLLPPDGTRGEIFLRLVEMAAWESAGNKYVNITVWAGPSNVKGLEEKRFQCIISLVTALPESYIGGDLNKDQLIALLNEQLLALSRRK